ncbi:MAG: TIGR02996 domain-containing protein, partial [Gemmataceae bacterium]
MLEKLALADWLEENGDADRAQVIRLQMAMGRLEKDDPTHEKMKAEVELLERKNTEKWFGWTRDDREESVEKFHRSYDIAGRWKGPFHLDGLVCLKSVKKLSSLVEK